MTPAPFRLHNTLSKRVETFEPQEAGKVRLYVCGMTVYDKQHVGHARAMVTFDMVARYLRHRGWDVSFVRNFTDVDDKIIARAAEAGEEPLALAERFIDAFKSDCRELGLVPPTAEPRVSESIDEIQAMIAKLIDRGHAYVANDSVWFDVATFDEYGKLSGQRVDEVRSADPQDGKRAPQDFALWKAAKSGEPAWNSPWGSGRPGWHIECSAMAHAALGEQLDIHGGGLDLVFPHHENEIAQSECALGTKPYARYWMHNGLLTMASGQKMGKSLGNAFTIDAALEEFPAEALRLYYLQVHYRSPLPWSVEALPEALALLARLYEARETAESMEGNEPIDRIINDLGADAKEAVRLAEEFPSKFYAAMDDDFNSAKALGYAFELARATNRFANHRKAQRRGGPIAKKVLEAFEVLPVALGLLGQDTASFDAEVKAKRLPSMGLSAETVEEALDARRQARGNKDYDQADAIRQDLEQKGVVVMDQGDHTAWRVRLSTLEENNG